jgi:hypothetical protein
MNKITNLTKKSTAIVAMFALVLSFVGIQPERSRAATTWDVSGDYVINMNYDGTDYSHDVSLTQAGDDSLTGNGGSPAGANVYTYTLNSGSVVDNTINFTANYTATADAVSPQTVLSVEGTIAEDGSMSGTWSDNYQGGERSGTWESISGLASGLPGSLAAEDFGVVDYDTGLGQLRGYSAGFGLTDATFENVQSVVVKLYAGDTLLQTNTGTAKIGDEITGNQISSPFDVSGDFDYTTDGFWTNSRESEYGQSEPATKVVATVTLENGKVVTAENTNLSGDPETIYPEENPETVQVTILKYVDGAQATGISADNSDFTMNASWDAENIGAGSGQYTLNENGYNGDPTPYQAMTVEMTSGADYSTSEVMNELTGASCEAETPYSLVGYTSGDSLSAAQNATIGSSANLTNITSDKYIIVWNDDCSTATNGGNIGGEVIGSEGELEVTSVEVVDGTATADGTYENGWSYVFHVTVPTDETGLAMKFANWVKTGDEAETIAAANNMRISSDQADNGGATVSVTAADTYTSPDLNLTGDLDTEEDGLQVEILVEVRIPAGTDNGSYTTNYGVRTQ